MDTGEAGNTERTPPSERVSQGELVRPLPTTPPSQAGPPGALIARALENAINREIGDSASTNIQALRGELGAKYVGWAAYYQEKDVELRRDRAVAVSQEAFNKALAVVTLALDCGPVKNTDVGATMLLPHQWFRVALITVAAAVRGALRSDDIEHAAGFELDPSADQLEVHPQLKRPHTEGEALQAMLEHLAGLLRGWRGLPGDANPETFLDYLMTRARDDLETLAVMETKVEVDRHRAEHLQRLKDVAEPELRAEVEEWADGLRALFEAQYFDRLFSRIKQDLASAAWADQVRKEEVETLHTVCLRRREEIFSEAAEQVREEARRLQYEQATTAGREEALKAAEAQIDIWKKGHFNDLKNLAIKGIEDQAKLTYAPNITRWQGEKLEELKREAFRQAEAEARNIKIERIERRERELEEEIDGLVKSRNVHLILKAAKDLGLSITDNGKGRSEGPKAQPPSKPRGDKRTALGQQVSSVRGRSPSRTPTQTPRAKPAPLPETRRAPSAAPSMTADRDEIIEVLSRVASPIPGMQSAADSMHTPRSLVEAYASPEPDTVPPHHMAGPMVPPETPSDGVGWGTEPPAHNPATAMEVDAAEAAPAVTGDEGTPLLAAPPSVVESLAEEFNLDQNGRALLMLVDRLLNKVTTRLDRVEAHQNHPRPREKAPVPGADRADRPPPPAQVATQLQPTLPAPPAPPSWAKVAASRTGLIVPDKVMARHAAETSQAAQAQKWTNVGRAKGGGASAPAQALTTEVVVIRKGGFADTRREEALRARNPRDIVMEVRTEVERQCRNPIKVLSGRWSTTYQRTGNFVYTLAGEVSLPAILSYKQWLCGPFPDADIAPTAGWTWSHLRGVPTTDEDGSKYDKAALLKEVRSNAMFEEAVYTAAPSWQIPPEKHMAERAMVIVAYVDPTGEISKHALADGVFMFGSPVKFVVLGDKPALIQCGRCHLLGHNKNSLLCKVPRTAVRCFHCGGSHDSTRHGFECKGQHKVAGRCDCAVKCILCGKQGHHARSRACPKRGDFAPPKLARAQDTPTDRQPAPAPQARAKGKQREAPPHQRVDDDEAPPIPGGWDEPLFSPSTIQGPLPTAQEPPQTAQEAPQAGPSGRITSIVPARRVQPGHPAGGYGTKLIAENEAEGQQMRAPETGNTQVAAATVAPPNPPNA
ncbi:hypothetical protein EDB85DRAFT_2155520 [Lactarius pseudohatsudake]|nr:hypothetical protein EDB85DRAFT_2155520 [Lactarius pseudohatsudake]